MTNISCQVLESIYDLDGRIINETWFITQATAVGKPLVVRRDVYKIKEVGSVVAFKDCGVGADPHLYVEESFLNCFRDEPEFEVILQDQGTPTSSMVKTFKIFE